MNERSVGAWILLLMVILPMAGAVAWTTFGPEPDPRVETPAPMVGDAGAWTWRQTAPDGTIQESAWYFQWQEPATLVDPDGRTVATRPLTVVAAADDSQRNTWHMASDDPGTSIALERTHHQASESSVSASRHLTFGDAAPCGFWSMTGHWAPSDATVRPACMLPDGSKTINATPIEAVAVTDHLVTLSGADGSTLHLTSGTSAALAAEAADEDGVLHQWILTGHKAGTTPYEPVPPTAPVLPEILADPALDPGTDSLPWSLSDALAVAEAEPVRQFLKDHPDAWLYRAEFDQNDPRFADQMEQMSWRIFFQSGDQEREFYIFRTTTLGDVTVYRVSDQGAPGWYTNPPGAAPPGFDWESAYQWLVALSPPDIDGGFTTGWHWAPCAGCPPTLDMWRATGAADPISDPDPVAVDTRYEPQSSSVRTFFDGNGRLARAQTDWSEGHGTGISEERLAEAIDRRLGGEVTKSQVVAPDGLHDPRSEALIMAAGLAASAALAGWWLRRVPSLFLFTRIGQKQILEHPTRRRILEAIDADPGIHFAELAKRSRLSFGVLTHHLKKLVHVEEVVVHEAKGYTCYFRVGSVDRRLMALVPLLKSAGARKVMDAVRQQPGQNVSTLAVHAGLSPSVVHHHIKRMKASGLVRTERQGRSVCLYPEPVLRQAAGVGA